MSSFKPIVLWKDKVFPKARLQIRTRESNGCEVVALLRGRLECAFYSTSKTPLMDCIDWITEQQSRVDGLCGQPIHLSPVAKAQRDRQARRAGIRVSR